MDNYLFALGGLLIGLVVGWFVFSPATVKEEVTIEEPAPVTPAEPEAAAPAEPEVVPMPPQETVEPAPVEAPKAAN